MDEEVMYKHIELYVNNYTLSLGEEGRRSVNKLFEIAGAATIFTKTKG
jgi:1,4-dihydroxy-6-naphthoate synthase